MIMKQNIKFFYDEDGNRVGVLIKYSEFEKLMEQLEDLHSLYKIYKRKGKKEKIIPYEQLREELFGVNK